MTEPTTGAPHMLAGPAADDGAAIDSAANDGAATDGAGIDGAGIDSAGIDGAVLGGETTVDDEATALGGEPGRIKAVHPDAVDPASDLASTDPDASDRTWPGWLLPALSLLWLVAKLWSSHQQIQQSGGGTVAVATAALALPGVLQATLVGGVGAALLAALALGRAPIDRSRRLRVPVVLAAGALAGVIVMIPIFTVYGHLPSVAAIATAVVLAGLLGGAIVAALPSGTAAAGLAAALAVFICDIVLNSNAVLPRMMDGFGAGSTAASVVAASNWVAFVDSVLGGIVAGIVAFRYLRRPGTGAAARFPSYLIAGGTAGLVFLVAEVLTRLGGMSLLAAVRLLSPEDSTAVDLANSSRAIHGLVIAFVGAFVALIAFGRTLPPAGSTAKPAPNRRTV